MYSVNVFKGGGGGAVAGVSGSRCLEQSFFSVMVRWMPLFTVMIFLRSTQAEHLEGGRDKEEVGAVSETGSTAGQEMEAWRTPQCVQKLGWLLVTTKGFPR